MKKAANTAAFDVLYHVADQPFQLRLFDFFFVAKQDVGWLVLDEPGM
ncbi:MAG: hypothetical protein RIC14_01110 [Filomicrobium sp.]